MIGERVLEGYPPETFQANGGSDLMAWVAYNNNAGGRESKLEALDSNASWVNADAHAGAGYGPLRGEDLRCAAQHSPPQRAVLQQAGVHRARSAGADQRDAVDARRAVCAVRHAGREGRAADRARDQRDPVAGALPVREPPGRARRAPPTTAIFFQGQLDAERILDSPYLRDCDWRPREAAVVRSRSAHAHVGPMPSTPSSARRRR